MSRTTILKVWPNDRVESWTELSNSWGFAPPVWDAMSLRYFNKPMGLMSGLEYLWPLYKDKAIPIWQRAVLCMTFDNAYVGKDFYKWAAESIRLFLLDFPAIAGNTNHWSEIAQIFRSNPDCPAIGFWGTSVSEMPFQGVWNEEIENYDPFDWEKAFEVFKAVNEE